METVLGVRCPTYVDDLSAHREGPTETALALVLRISLGRVAGLRVEGHTCTWLGHGAAQRR